MFRRGDVVTAYQRAITRQVGVQQREASSRMRDLVGVVFLELAVGATAAVAGVAVRDVTWPAKTILTSIRRGDAVIVPAGSTVLEPGDEVALLTDAAEVDEVRHLVASD